jgi:hypothetical protein
MTNPESNHAATAGDALVRGAAAGAAGEANRWAEIAVDSLKNSEQTNNSRGSGKSAEKAGEAAQSLGSKVGDAISDKMINLEENHKIIGTDGISKEIYKHFREVTDEQRKQAKEKLEKELSELIPEKDRTSLKNLQSAIVDGDLGKLQSTLKELSANPEQLKKIVDALGKQFGKELGVDLKMDSAGNVLLYEHFGNTALSVNPKTGESTLRPMETQMDGSVVLKPGEIINRTTGDVMKNIGDTATRSLSDGPIGYGRIGIIDSKVPWLEKPKEHWIEKLLEPSVDTRMQKQEQKHYPRIPEELNQLQSK